MLLLFCVEEYSEEEEIAERSEENFTALLLLLLPLVENSVFASVPFVAMERKSFASRILQEALPPQKRLVLIPKGKNLFDSTSNENAV